MSKPGTCRTQVGKWVLSDVYHGSFSVSPGWWVCDFSDISHNVLFYMVSGCVVCYMYSMEYFPFHQVRRCAVYQTHPMEYFVSPDQNMYPIEYFLFYQVSRHDLSDIFHHQVSRCVICQMDAMGYFWFQQVRGCMICQMRPTDQFYSKVRVCVICQVYPMNYFLLHQVDKYVICQPYLMEYFLFTRLADVWFVRYISHVLFFVSPGRRACLGESLARMELFLFLSAMVQRFIFLPPEDGEMPSLQGILGMTLSPQPFRVRAVPRN